MGHLCIYLLLSYCILMFLHHLLIHFPFLHSILMFWNHPRSCLSSFMFWGTCRSCLIAAVSDSDNILKIQPILFPPSNAALYTVWKIHAVYSVCVKPLMKENYIRVLYFILFSFRSEFHSLNLTSLKLFSSTEFLHAAEHLNSPQ